MLSSFSVKQGIKLFTNLSEYKTKYHQNLEEEMSVNIFVYGTLKTGEPNHYWFQEASANNGARVDLVGAGITLEKLPLIVATEFNIPMLLGGLVTIQVTI